MSIIYDDKNHQNEVAFQQLVSNYDMCKRVFTDTSIALDSLKTVGCDPIYLEALDGNNKGLESLLGEEVTWKNMGAYDLHQLKIRIRTRLEEENTNAVNACNAALESIWSNIRERVLLFMSFESERKECISVLVKQISALTSEQKKQLEDTVISYDTFDQKTASLVVSSLKKTIDLCNKNMSFIQKFAKTPEEDLSDMDKEYIQELKDKLASASIGDNDAIMFFSDIIKKKVPNGKSYKELGYNISNISSIASEVQRNVMNFYKQLDAMYQANEKLGNAEAKRGNYGTSDLWDIYMSIFKILRDADKCYKVIEAHLFRTQQKVIRMIKSNDAQNDDNKQY